MTKTETIKTRNFSKAFWVANTVELFERAAYYAVFIAITLYLTNEVGFNDIWSAWIGGCFAAGLYLLPPFTGAYADKIGFRKAIILAFSLLAIGYFFLGLLPYKQTVIPALSLVMFGGSFIKSVITGTVALTTTEANRARGYSVFYMIVNVGAFSGKTLAYPLRIKLGLVYINFFAALMCSIAIVIVFLLYRNVEMKGEGKSFKEVWQGLVRVVTNLRLIILILIVSGFWIIQHQMYATMPKYVIRTVGAHSAPEWIANVNPAVVMIFVVLITHLMRKVKDITSMSIGMLLMPFSALAMSASYFLTKITGESVSIFGLFNMHPITLMMILGIVIQGLAECCISPRYLEFFSLQAPKGEEGLYLGFSHLHSFFAYLFGFGISGYLLTKYCPDPATLTPEQIPLAYKNAHVIWYYFIAIGLIAGIALLIYNFVINKIDQKKEITREKS